MNDQNTLLIEEGRVEDCRIGGPEHEKLTQPGSPRRRHCDARLEVVACGEGHRPEGFDLALGRELEAAILEAKARPQLRCGPASHNRQSTKLPCMEERNR
jgi:hypothetical protein